MKRGKRCRCCGALDRTTSVRHNEMLRGWNRSPMCDWCVKLVLQEATHDGLTSEERIKERLTKGLTP